MNFSCSLGGINIRCCAEYFPIQQPLDSILAREFISFPPYEPAVEYQEDELQVQISPSKEGKISISHFEKILSHQRASLYKTEKGYLQILHGNPAEDNFLWTLEIDSQFAQFDYALFLDNIAKIRRPLIPSQLALSLFLLQHSFINQQGLIIHAAGGAVCEKGLVFPAPSGTGKSTLSRLLLADSENRLFSEERLILRTVDKSWHIWGTPWHGEGRIARNESTPLSALVFLRQARTTELTEISPAIGLQRLLQTVSIPWYSKGWSEKGLALCERLLENIPVVELAFRPDQTAKEAIEKYALSLN